jgi:hypothetical protein
MQPIDRASVVDPAASDLPAGTAHAYGAFLDSFVPGPSLPVPWSRLDKFIGRLPVRSSRPSKPGPVPIDIHPDWRANPRKGAYRYWLPRPWVDASWLASHPRPGKRRMVVFPTPLISWLPPSHSAFHRRADRELRPLQQLRFPDRGPYRRRAGCIADAPRLKRERWDRPSRWTDLRYFQ